MELSSQAQAWASMLSERTQQKTLSANSSRRQGAVFEEAHAPQLENWPNCSQDTKTPQNWRPNPQMEARGETLEE